MRLGQPHRRIEGVLADHRLRGEELGNHLGTEQALAPGRRPSGQQHPQPLRHVADARPDGSGGRDTVHAGVADDGHRAVDLVVRRGDVGLLRQCGCGRDRAGHPERRQQARAHELAPRLAAHCRDDLTGRGVHHVLIGEVRAHRALERHVTEPGDDLAGRGRLFVPQQIGIRHTGPMRQQVADPHLAGHVRVVEGEPRQVLGDRVVPPELALVDEHAERRRGHRLGRRADGEQRVLVDRLGRAEAAHAVALGEHDLAVLDHGDRQARRLPVTHRLRDVGVEAGERTSLGQRRRWRDEREGEDEGETRLRLFSFGMPESLAAVVEVPASTETDEAPDPPGATTEMAIFEGGATPRAG